RVPGLARARKVPAVPRGEPRDASGLLVPGGLHSPRGAGDPIDRLPDDVFPRRGGPRRRSFPARTPAFRGPDLNREKGNGKGKRTIWQEFLDRFPFSVFRFPSSDPRSAGGFVKRTL